MSREARVEELSESDPDEVDISTIASGSNASPSTATNPTLIDPSQIPSTRGSSVTREKAKSWQCLYPLYFDARRTRAEGRRVASQLAVENPLAREIADAVWSLNLQLAIEPEKTHPKDWANPGRIRVLVKENGKAANRNVKNKHDLYIKVAQHLMANPVNERSPLRMRVAGMPPSANPPSPPAIPRGWKMNSILPLHSAALSGGGVSENLFKDMMAEMQGEPSAGSGKPKKKGKG